MYRNPLTALSLASLLLAVLVTSACAPKRQESWNSYYYGTERRSSAGVVYDEATDNDDSYRLPQGYWQDDQIPQGQKW